jgi:uncharacterized phiE125 gp8 family phage protein
MKLVIATAATSEPVTVADAADHLRVDFSDDDALIASQLQAAREYAETFTRRAFITRTYDLWFDEWPSFPLLLPHPPLQSVTSIKYYDEDDTEATWAATNYLVDAYSTPGRIVEKSDADSVSVTLREANAVKVTFVAGYGSASAVPEQLKAAMLLMTGDLYEHRENTITGTIVSSVNLTVQNLLWPYRVEW